MTIGCLASIPEREHLLEQVIESICYQVDHLYVYLNGYKSVPSFLNRYGLTPILADNYWGAAAKMLHAKDHDGYYFCFDDDLEYPDNYVAVMKYRIDMYKGKAAVSLHGAKMPNGNKVYYFDDNRMSENVDIIGTGVTAFYAPNLKLPMDVFVEKNKVDLQFGLFCRNNGIERVVVPHLGGWVKNLDVDEVTPALRHNTNRIEKDDRWILHTKSIDG